MRRKVPDCLGAGASRRRHRDCLWDSVGLNCGQMDPSHFQFNVFSLGLGLVQPKLLLGTYLIPKSTRWDLNLGPGDCVSPARGIRSREGAERRENGGMLRVGQRCGTHHLAGSAHTWLRYQAVAAVIGGIRRKTCWPPPQRFSIGFGTRSLFSSPNLEPPGAKYRLKRRLITFLRVVRQAVIGRRAHGFGL